MKNILIFFGVAVVTGLFLLAGCSSYSSSGNTYTTTTTTTTTT